MLELADFRRAHFAGLSDEQQRHEMAAQRRLAEAIAQMRAAIDELNSSSVLVEIEPSAFDDFVSDECPSPEYWAEKLSMALRE